MRPAIPAAWVDRAVGNRLNKLIDQELFRRLVLRIISVNSANLCW